MYENKTFENIIGAVMDRVPNTLDKREGSVIYDAVAPVCAELAQAYIFMDFLLDQSFADTAKGEYLERRTAEHGVNREGATYAVVRGEFVPDLNLIGQRFNCGKFNYVVTGHNELTCETLGSEPNSVTGTLIPIEPIDGLESAELVEILKVGEDPEDDESLYQRFEESLRGKAYGGNEADYKAKTNAIEGVGGTKVTRAWNGGGTVKLTIIASDYSAPTQYLVDEVQAIIDPTKDGQGVGIAPVGHIVTVEGVEGKKIDIETTFTFVEGWNWNSAKGYVFDAIDGYFKEIAKNWRSTEVSMVRVSQLEARILNAGCVLDITNTKINGGTANIQLGYKEIPVRGTVNGS